MYNKAYLTKVENLISADELKPTPGYFVYQTADSAAAVKAADYFDAAGDILYVGSVLVCDCAGVLQHLKVTQSPTEGDAHVVVAAMSTGGNVTVGGQATTVTAADTIATGLSHVVAVVATLDDDPGDNPISVNAHVGDQAGAPVAGSFVLKTWQDTAGNDPTPVAATTFGKKVNWIAFGAL